MATRRIGMAGTAICIAFMSLRYSASRAFACQKAQQAQPTPATTRPVAEVPFTLENNQIIMKVKLGKDVDSASRAPTVRFLLDTGASFTFLSREALADNKFDFGAAAKPIAGLQIKGSGDSVGVSATQVDHISIVLGPITLDDSILIVPMGSDVRRFNIDGAIGDDVIGSFVTEIDYKTQMIRFWDPETFTPPAPSENFSAIPLKLRVYDRLPAIEAEITPFGFTPTHATMRLDTGDAGSVTLYGPFVASQSWRDALPHLIPAKIAGLGGRGNAYNGRLHSVQFGSAMLNQPTVIFSVSKEGALAETSADGQFGGVVLRRFTMILDYGRGKLYLRPNEGAADLFPPERYLGFHMLPPVTASGGYAIELVDEASPAFAAGVRVGDILYKIDGQSVSDLSYEKLKDMVNISGSERILEVGSTDGANRRIVKVTPVTF